MIHDKQVSSPFQVFCSILFTSIPFQVFCCQQWTALISIPAKTLFCLSWMQRQWGTLRVQNSTYSAFQRTSTGCFAQLNNSEGLVMIRKIVVVQYITCYRQWSNNMSPVKRICVFEHSVMTNFNCACPVIQRGQGSGFLSEGSSWLTACMSEQRRFWRDCADAQARLNLRCSHRL